MFKQEPAQKFDHLYPHYTINISRFLPLRATMRLNLSFSHKSDSGESD